LDLAGTEDLAGDDLGFTIANTERWKNGAGERRRLISYRKNVR
jgi:hypothetical protein